MGVEYIKEQKVREKSEEERNLELFISVIKTKQELNLAHQNFEYAEDGLIDYYSYQIKANRSKLDYLIQKAKKKGIALDMLNERYIKNNKAK